MSKEQKVNLIQDVVLAVRMHQNASDQVDDSATGYFGINRTDARCLDIIDQCGRVTAGELAVASGLTTGAITTVLDRLERAGHVRRIRDDVDRRRVMVELTEDARDRAMQVYGPIASDGIAQLARYTVEELTLIRDFMHAGREMLVRHVARVRAMAAEAASERAAAPAQGG
jgi:DNA-binding MarR family transcriptional regulator